MQPQAVAAYCGLLGTANSWDFGLAKHKKCPALQCKLCNICLVCSPVSSSELAAPDWRAVSAVWQPLVTAPGEQQAQQNGRRAQLFTASGSNTGGKQWRHAEIPHYKVL
jgi:hypothetical protein